MQPKVVRWSYFRVTETGWQGDVMAAIRGRQPGLPDWLPEDARLYLQHVSGGGSIRALARSTGQHASTVLRRVRRIELRRDDPLLDEALERISDTAWDRGEPHTTPIQKRGDTTMTAQIRSRRETSGETQNLREAARILRRLCEAGALLAVAPDLPKAVVLKGTLRLAVVDRLVAQDFVLREWIAVARHGRVTSYAITAVGRAALKRMLADSAGPGDAGTGFAEAASVFAEQHRDWDTRSDPRPAPADGAGQGEASGRSRRMRFNLAESPLTALARRRDKDGLPFLTPQQVAAGERLREDFELAQLGPRVAQDWDRFLTAGDRGGWQPAAAGGGGSSAARDRVARALHDLGPGLGDMVLRTCCFLEGLEVAEQNLGWSARSGKIVLRIALTRLMRHYEETYGKGLPLIG